ncbi:MAG: ADP-ribosylglycohydrolase family protein [Pseudonocardiaceae bacterium]
MSALAAIRGGSMPGSVDIPINNSKGCGGVMRAAPAGLWVGQPEHGFRCGAQACTITHGHPCGYLSGGTLAVIVHQLLDGTALPAAIETARTELACWEGHEEQLCALDAAVALAGQGRPTPEKIAEHLGGGWVGEEALAIAVCAALTARDLVDGLRLAVNHSGDSDSTGSIAGNILGTRHGVHAIPMPWLEQLELHDTITTLAQDAIAEFGPNPPTHTTWSTRYAGN